MLSSDSKGFKLLSKLGYKPGDRLGAESNPYALSEPVGLEIKEDRGGIGMDSEKKRKVREAAAAAEQEAKRAKVDEGDFRERVAREREEKRAEGQWWGAMKIAEGLDTDSGQEAGVDVGTQSDDESKSLDSHNGNDGDARRQPGPSPAKNTSSSKSPTNLLWRPLPRDRAEKEREQRMRHDLMQSLSRKPAYDDAEEDRYDRLAFGKEEVELDPDAEDPELDAYVALPATERLQKVVRYLRDAYWYCFWCKCKYPDRQMEGCPGETEDDHD